MPTTSSAISSRRSRGLNVVGLLAWSALAAARLAQGFAVQVTQDPADSEPLYQWEFAIGSVVAYGIIIALTLAMALAYPSVREALGLRRFSWRWVGIALGLIALAFVIAAALEPILHGGEEQGLAPERWRSNRALTYAVNGLVASTVVPLGEELFYRGLGIRVFGFLGDTAAVTVTALVFGLAHGVLGALPPLVFFGLALGWIRVRSRSVWPGVLAHGAYNSLGIIATFALLQ